MWIYSRPEYRESPVSYTHLDVYKRQIGDRAMVGAVQDAFAQIPATYIADGHHRAASAVKVEMCIRDRHCTSIRMRLPISLHPMSRALPMQRTVMQGPRARWA